MGVFDRMIVDKAFDSLAVEAGEKFQTKSLKPCMNHYRISAEGALFNGEHPIPFHGDIHLLRRSGKEPQELVARFTNGCLEWICRLADYPADLSALLGRGS